MNVKKNLFCRGDNVEDAFLDTAKKIYQNIQDGRFVRLTNVSNNLQLTSLALTPDFLNTILVPKFAYIIIMNKLGFL